MKVILSQDVPNLGKMGVTVNVADGYARNFLLPRKLAVSASSSSAKQIEHEMRIIRRREEKRREEMMAVAKQLAGLTLEFKARAGEEDKIFGSVTSAHIAEKLAELGHAIDRKSIVLDEPLKSLGVFSVAVKLPGGIDASVKVWVQPLEEAAETTA